MFKEINVIRTWSNKGSMPALIHEPGMQQRIRTGTRICACANPFICTRFIKLQNAPVFWPVQLTRSTDSIYYSPEITASQLIGENALLFFHCSYLFKL